VFKGLKGRQEAMKPNNDYSWEILLVEDNPADVCLTQEALKESNILHNLQVAEDGVAALEYLQQEGGNAHAIRPDIILMDLNMPRMGGHELLAIIKSDDALKSIPVIVLSSSTATEDISKAYALNANCYARKPMNIDPFIEVIKGIQEFWFKTVLLPLAPTRVKYLPSAFQARVAVSGSHSPSSCLKSKT
jgi:two-component system response regulator